MVAGVNPVAVDVIAAEIAGLPKRYLWVEQAAYRLGLDGSDPATITVAGIPVAEARVADFQLPHISDVQFGLPRFIKDRLRHQLTSRPGVDPQKCRLCGICRNACPPEAITIADGTLTFDYRRCIRCFCCRELCPEAALTVTDGLILRLIKVYKSRRRKNPAGH
jgi:ferredoxin